MKNEVFGFSVVKRPASKDLPPPDRHNIYCQDGSIDRSTMTLGARGRANQQECMSHKLFQICFRQRGNPQQIFIPGPYSELPLHFVTTRIIISAPLDAIGVQVQLCYPSSLHELVLSLQPSQLKIGLLFVSFHLHKHFLAFVWRCSWSVWVLLFSN